MVKERENEKTMGYNIVVPHSDSYFYPSGMGENDLKIRVSTFKGMVSEEDFFFFANL